MTRINVVPVTELCDQHLLAEHREITRIPSGLFKGVFKYEYADRSQVYVLGPGHVKFFTNKLEWLHKRHMQLNIECSKRGFNMTFRVWKDPLLAKGFAFEDWEPDNAALAVNRERIKERMPKKPRFTKYA